MFYRKDYHSPTIKQLIKEGLKSGDVLYSYGLGFISKAVFVRVVNGKQYCDDGKVLIQEYVELQFVNEDKPFRTTLHDCHWDITEERAIVSAFNEHTRIVRDSNIELRRLDKLISKKRITIQ